MKRRITAMIMIICMLLTITPLLSVNPEAATAPVINNFTTDKHIQNSKVYDALRTGSYKAVKNKNNGEWYYKFTKDGFSVYVKLSAFTSTAKNSYTGVNKALTEGIMSDDGIPVLEKFAWKKSSKATYKVAGGVKLTKYKTYISWMNATAARSSGMPYVELQCTKKSHVQFTYSDKIALRTGTGYKKPKTASEYTQALARSKSYSLDRTLKPEFTVEVVRPGTNRVSLQTCELRGCGIGKTNVPLTKFIQVGFTTAKVIAELNSAKINYKSLYSLYSQGKTLLKTIEENGESKEYVNNNLINLSKKEKGKIYSCTKMKFTSPIELKNYDDYFRTKVNLTKAPSTSGTKTIIQVELVIK